MNLRLRLLVASFTVALALPAAANAQAPDAAGELAAPVTDAVAAGGGGQGGGNGQGNQPQPPANEQKPVKIKVKIKGAKNGKVKVGHRVKVRGHVFPFVGRQRVEIRLIHRGRTISKAKRWVREVKGKRYGAFKMRSKELVRPGGYRVRITKPETQDQAGTQKRSGKFTIKYPDLDPGDRGPAVKLFNKLLRREAYFNTDTGKYGSHTERAVMAFRKVNGMSRTWQANPAIFRKLAAGKGGFKIKHPGAGKHVEVDISKQVMALSKGGKAKYVFHVSTGAAATPSDPGGFRFYRKDPGYNSIGMYYSVYYNRGEATHGYKSVPPYPASHGCIRNPIPDSKFIYNWISLGDKMYVYH